MHAHENNSNIQGLFFILPNSVFSDMTLNGSLLRIYMLIYSFMHTTGVAYPSNKWIASKVGIDERRVRDNISKLVEKGYIERVIINDKRHLKIKTNPMPDPQDLNDKPSNQDGGGTKTAGGGGQKRPGGEDENVHIVCKDDYKKINPVVVYSEPDRSKPEPTHEKPQQQQKFSDKKTRVEHQAITDPENIKLFESRFSQRQVTIEELFTKCQKFNEAKGRWIDQPLFARWISLENPDNYAKRGSHQAQGEQNYNLDYMAYLSQFRNDRDILKLRPKDSQPLSLEEWIPCHRREVVIENRAMMHAV